MPVTKRVLSPEVLGRPSPYHPSVTLYEPVSAGPRRSKRVKVKQEPQIISFKEEQSPEPDAPVASTSRHARATMTKVDVEDIELKLVEVEVKPKPRTKKAASPKKTKAVPQSLAVPHPAPPRWKEAYDTIKRMREHIVAPVDTMGCAQAQSKETDPKVRSLACASCGCVDCLTVQCRPVGSRRWCL